MPRITDLSASAGNSVITTYNLEFNGGAGSIFYEVAGETSEQLQTSISVSTTPGVTYLFRYRVKNIFGFSDGYSPITELKSAISPETPTDLQTSIQGRNVKIQWTPASDNYDQVVRFEIEFESASHQWIQETLTCDGADDLIKTTNECLVPLTTLLSNYNLQQGDSVNVRVAATNTIGTSSYIQTQGVLIETVPLAP